MNHVAWSNTNVIAPPASAALVDLTQRFGLGQ